MKKVNTKKGYTIVEITLAMAFIGVLLVTIATIVLNIISIYQKGLSLRAVNSTGRELVSAFTSAIQSAPIKNIPSLCTSYSNASARDRCNADKGQKIVYQQNASSRTISLATENALSSDSASTHIANPPTHGAFCTGRYSFIWNTGYVLNDSYNLSNERAKFTYKVGGASRTIRDFRLIRVEDEGRNICQNNIDTNTYYLKTNNEYFLDNVASDSMVSADFLKGSDDNLALYDFQVFVPTQHHITAHSYYSGTFILATLQGNVNIKTTGNFCNTVPDDLNTDFAYCAINKFNFAAQATGELNENEQREQRRN